MGWGGVVGGWKRCSGVTDQLGPVSNGYCNMCGRAMFCPYRCECIPGAKFPIKKTAFMVFLRTI